MEYVKNIFLSPALKKLSLILDEKKDKFTIIFNKSKNLSMEETKKIVLDKF
jgi:hypothetical protein